MSKAIDPVDSILMIGFGGPTSPDDVMPFLRIVVEGRNVPEDRLLEVVHHYGAVGGRSPYNDLTMAQARTLERWMTLDGHPLPVYVGIAGLDRRFDDPTAAPAFVGGGGIGSITFEPEAFTGARP